MSKASKKSSSRHVEDVKIETKMINNNNVNNNVLLLQNKHPRYQNISRERLSVKRFDSISKILFIGITSGPHHQNLRYMF